MNKKQKKLEMLLNKFKHTIEYGKTLPEFIQPTYWETNKEILDNLQKEIKELETELKN